MSSYDNYGEKQLPIMYRRGPEYYLKGTAPIYTDLERLRYVPPVKKTLRQRLKSSSQFRIVLLLAVNIGILAFVSTMLDRNKVQELQRIVDGMQLSLSVASSPEETKERMVVLNLRQISQSAHSNIVSNFLFESFDALGTLIDTQSQQDLLPGFIGDERQFLASIPAQANSVKAKIVFTMSDGQNSLAGIDSDWQLEVSFTKEGAEQ